MPRIRVPGALHHFTGGATDIELTATTVRAALAELEHRHPGISAKLFDGSHVKPFIKIFVGADEIGSLYGLDTKLAEHDEVAIIHAIAGGTGVAHAPRQPMTLITISEEVRTAIYAHALAVFPEECCGYLTGPPDARTADTAVACRNAQRDGEHPIAPDRSAETSFMIAGAELIRFAKCFDTDSPPRVVYHSHTNGRAYFSAIDRQLAAGPSYPVQHLVIGVAGGEITEAAQFAWSEPDRDYVEIARWRP